MVGGRNRKPTWELLKGEVASVTAAGGRLAGWQRKERRDGLTGHTGFILVKPRWSDRDENFLGRGKGMTDGKGRTWGDRGDRGSVG